MLTRVYASRVCITVVYPGICLSGVYNGGIPGYMPLGCVPWCITRVYVSQVCTRVGMYPSGYGRVYHGGYVPLWAPESLSGQLFPGKEVPESLSVLLFPVYRTPESLSVELFPVMRLPGALGRGTMRRIVPSLPC